jgi:RNA polymerase sigma-70 factor, ECF subfamily
VLADADDVVQEAWLRWSAADRAEIDNTDAWLNTVVSRLAIDRLRRRKREEERYVGPWLPSPVVQRVDDPADAAELADSMTTAFLIMLERLSPDERAAFLLADVFGERYDSIAVSLGRSAEACRQLASRARRKVRDAELARRDELGASDELVRRFLTALAIGDEATAVACLAPDAVYVSDGGPHRRAARVPVREPARIVRLLVNLVRRWPGRATSRRRWSVGSRASSSSSTAASSRPPASRWSTGGSSGSSTCSTPTSSPPPNVSRRRWSSRRRPCPPLSRRCGGRTGRSAGSRTRSSRTGASRRRLR